MLLESDLQGVVVDHGSGVQSRLCSKGYRYIARTADEIKRVPQAIKSRTTSTEP